jgi:putative phosphoesterase
MKLALISDTHGNLAAWEAAWNLVLHDADLIIHCGDALYHGPKFTPAAGYDAGALAARMSACPVPILMARGNADSEVDQLVLSFPMQQPYLLAQVEGLRLLATHGHRMSPDDLLALGEQWRLDYVLTGHTHVPAYRRRGRTVHLNPGTTTYPLSPDPALRKRTCAAIIDGAPHWWDLETGEETTVPLVEVEP